MTNDPTNLTHHDQIVHLVERMLDLNKRLAADPDSLSGHNPQMKTILQRQIDTTDHQIDQLVYQLYNLTPDEIAIVEGRA